MRLEVCQSEKKGVFDLLVEGELWRQVHRSIFGSRPKFGGDFASLEELKNNFSKLERQRAKVFTVRRLALKSLPTPELCVSLQKVLVSDSTIEMIIKEFTDLGYLNDRDWIERFIQSERNRHSGPRRIAAKLRAKGIAEDEIVRALKNCRATQKKEIENLIKKRYYKVDLSEFKVKSKVFGALLRKGFDSEEVREVLDNLKLN